MWRREFVVYCVCVFLAGILVSASVPYQSIIAIRWFGLSEAGYSLLLVAISVSSLMVSLGIGHLSDVIADRRHALALALVTGALGFAIVVIFRSPSAFVIASVVLIPFAASVYQQLFAIVRAYTDAGRLAEPDRWISVARTVFSASWVLVPPAVGGLIWLGAPLLSVYLISAVACLVCLAAFVWGTRGRDTGLRKEMDAGTGPGAAPSPAASLRALASGAVLLPVCAVSLIDTAARLHAIVYGLIIVSEVGGGPQDIGLFAGAVALLEIPFMLGWSRLLYRWDKTRIIIIAAVLYALYLLLLSQAETMTQVYGLLILNAAASAALLSITISYLQDLIRGRPGLSSSLLAVTKFSGSTLAALIFSAAAPRLGYSGTVALAALACLAGAGLIAAIGRTVPAREGA